ncbi:hypothetical protein BH11BAC2_BH11BAC2_15790 [soil metagenome]
MLQTLLLLLSSLVGYDHGKITDEQIREIQTLRSDLISQNLVTADEMLQMDALISQVEHDNDCWILFDN